MKKKNKNHGPDERFGHSEIHLGGMHGGNIFALIDDEDFEKVDQYTWHLSESGYAMGNCPKMASMHRFLMQPIPKGLVVDHINHNRTDNRRVNLRVCTHAENMKNKKPRRKKVKKRINPNGNRVNKFKGSNGKEYETWLVD